MCSIRLDEIVRQETRVLDEKFAFKNQIIEISWVTQNFKSSDSSRSSAGEKYSMVVYRSKWRMKTEISTN